MQRTRGSGKVKTKPAGSRLSIATSIQKTKPRPVRRSGRRGDRVQSRSEIERILSEGGSNLETFPDSVKSVVSSGQDYLVKYELMGSTDAEYGSSLEQIKIPKRLKTLLKKKGKSWDIRF